MILTWGSYDQPCTQVYDKISDDRENDVVSKTKLLIVDERQDFPENKPKMAYSRDAFIRETRDRLERDKRDTWERLERD